eukprot:scaffold29707_cov34-Phaeocystis_antarctica.AAC.1
MRARASGRAAPSSSAWATIQEVSHLVITPYALLSSGLATIRAVGWRRRVGVRFRDQSPIPTPNPNPTPNPTPTPNLNPEPNQAGWRWRARLYRSVTRRMSSTDGARGTGRCPS